MTINAAAGKHLVAEGAYTRIHKVDVMPDDEQDETHPTEQPKKMLERRKI